MADAEIGSRLKMNVDGVVVDGEATTAADFASPIDAQQVADGTGFHSGLTLVTGAPNPGQAQLVESVQAANAASATNFAVGVRDRTPITFGPWRLNGLWTYDADLDRLNITTSQVRRQQGSLPMPAKPSQYVVQSLSQVGVNITIELRVRGILIGDDYPVLPDATVGTVGTGAREETTVDLSGVSFPASGGASYRVDFETKGGGGAQAYSVENHHFNF